MLSSSEQQSYIKPAERIENCFLTKVIRLKDPKTNISVLDFYFVQKGTNSIFKHREFDPTVEDPSRPVDPETKKKSITWCMNRIKHIVGRYVEIEGEIEGETWRDVIIKVWNLLKFNSESNTGTSNLIKVPCALKIILDKSEKYGRFPVFPDFISTEKFPKEFKTDPTYDKYSPTSSSNATSQPTSIPSSEVEEDDPFADDEAVELSSESQENSSIAADF